MGLIRLSLGKPMGIMFQPGMEGIVRSKTGGVYIGELDENGAAALSQKLQVGDELISINDIPIRNVPFDEVMRYVIDAVGDVDLLFRRSEEMVKVVNEIKHFRIVIPKPMGIVFENEKSSDGETAIRIGVITSAGNAARSGKLRVGDELTSVNGQPTYGCSFDDVMAYIIDADPEGVQLNFRRKRKSRSTE